MPANTHESDEFASINLLVFEVALGSISAGWKRVVELSCKSYGYALPYVARVCNRKSETSLKSFRQTCTW